MEEKSISIAEESGVRPKWMVGAPGGVFPEFFNNRAFIDRLCVSAEGDLSNTPANIITIGNNVGIAGRKSFYARALNGACSLSGNRLQLRYGPLGPRFPSFRLVLFSTAQPLTAAQVISVVTALFRTVTQHHVAELELAFDLSPAERFSPAQELFTGARRRFVYHGGHGSRTFYFGARTSPSQLKIYAKTDSVVRVEITLRRAFLRKHEIIAPADVLRLAQMDLSRMMEFHFISKTAVRAALKSLPNDWLKRDVLRRIRKGSLQELMLTVKWLDELLSPALRVSPLAGVIRRMQHRLIF